MKSQKIAFLFVAIFTLSLTGCGVVESDQDRLVRKFGKKVNELGTIYESITDEQSARAAVPLMEHLASELSRIKSELNELPAVSDKEYKRVFEAMIESTTTTREQTQRLAGLFQKNPKLALILAPAMDTIQDALKDGRRRR